MSLFPTLFLNAVVSIEVEIADGKGGTTVKPIATGFLLGRKLQDESNTYRVYLVTNRHVFVTAQGVPLREVHLRFNMTDVSKGTKYYKVDLLANDKPIWFQHTNPAVDIAVLPINTDVLRADTVEWFFFQDNDQAVLARDFTAAGIGTGDGVFVLGFPLGMRGLARNYVIVRHGIIARVDDEVLKDHYYYIDASAYPGNSGGPVIHKPEIVAIQGTTANPQASLIGVISTGVEYQDVAVSQQTGAARVVFTEQTGLIRIVPIDSVLEVVDQNLPKQVDARIEPSPAAPTEGAEPRDPVAAE